MTTDDQLGASSRALLDAARPAMGPDAEAARRMRARVAASVGGAAGVGATAKAAIALKVTAIAALALVVGIGAIAIVKARGGDDEPAAAPAIVPVVAPEPVIVAPPVIAPAAIEPEVELPAIDVGSSRVKPAAPKAAPSAITLAREVELVDHAMAAIKSHDARGALLAIRIYDGEAAGRGQLAEDAAAIEVEALCQLRDPSTAGKLAAFDARFPNSAQRSRLTNHCP